MTSLRAEAPNSSFICFIMSCPHGHAPRPEEEYGSGECYTCLEREDQVCGCDFCFAGVKRWLDAKAENTASPPWYVAFVKSRIGQTLTKKNYREAVFLCARLCFCAHKDDPAHDEQECFDEECEACGVVKCPVNEPLHFHHDGCPGCH